VFSAGCRFDHGNGLAAGAGWNSGLVEWVNVKDRGCSRRIVSYVDDRPRSHGGFEGRVVKPENLSKLVESLLGQSVGDPEHKYRAATKNLRCLDVRGCGRCINKETRTGATAQLGDSFYLRAYEGVDEGGAEHLGRKKSR